MSAWCPTVAGTDHDGGGRPHKVRSQLVGPRPWGSRLRGVTDQQTVSLDEAAEITHNTRVVGTVYTIEIVPKTLPSARVRFRMHWKSKEKINRRCTLHAALTSSGDLLGRNWAHMFA